MIRLTNLADYAVLLMGEISKDAEKRYSAQELSKITSMPVPTVSKILNILSRNDLLVSFRGLKGGFSLARKADDISIANIIEAVDGPIALTHCAEEKREPCNYDEICGMRGHWKIINQSVRNSLEAIKLEQINNSSETVG